MLSLQVQVSTRGDRAYSTESIVVIVSEECSYTIVSALAYTVLRVLVVDV